MIHQELTTPASIGLLRLRTRLLEMIATGHPVDTVAKRLCREAEALAPGVRYAVAGCDAAGGLYPLAGPRTEAIAAGADCQFHAIKNASGQRLGVLFVSRAPGVAPSARERGVTGIVRRLLAIAFTKDWHLRERERQATTDGLTGLPNRTAFDLALATVDDAPSAQWAICLVDLDNLKVVNDVFGHEAGDCLLAHAAASLAASGPGRVFRIGGDEFAILVSDPDRLEDLDAELVRCLDVLTAPATCGAHVLIPAATIGVAVAGPESGTAQTVRRNADLALYHAKEVRRGGCVRYWAGLGTRMTRRLTAMRELDAALREDRVVPFYQPIVRLDTGEIVGLEALCRIREGEGHMVAALFEEAVSDAHLATALTKRMATQVAADVRAWLDLGIPVQHVGINVSSADIHGGDLMTVFGDAFDGAGVDLRHLILEVTESVYMEDGGRVALELETMRARGLRVALDDFGTGYASLTHLMTVPVDVIKIDRSFVSGLEHDARSVAIVEALVGIARRMDIRVVAEGVETGAQADRLLELGCPLAQGFLHSAAVSFEATTAMLRRAAQWITRPAEPDAA